MLRLEKDGAAHSPEGQEALDAWVPPKTGWPGHWGCSTLPGDTNGQQIWETALPQTKFLREGKGLGQAGPHERLPAVSGGIQVSCPGFKTCAPAVKVRC